MTDPIPQELVDRMVALVREMTCYPSTSVYDNLKEAQAIANLLPKPIDPDLIRARKIGDDFTGRPGGGKYADGSWDDDPSCRALLAAIKLGRELERESVIVTGTTEEINEQLGLGRVNSFGAIITASGSVNSGSVWIKREHVLEASRHGWSIDHSDIGDGHLVMVSKP